MPDQVLAPLEGVGGGLAGELGGLVADLGEEVLDLLALLVLVIVRSGTADSYPSKLG